MWDQIEEVAAIAQAVNPEIDNIKGELRRLVYNRFLRPRMRRASPDGENCWGLLPHSSLKARREAVLAKLRTKPPINLITLKEIIEAYMGVTVEIYLDGYTVKVRYRGESRIADLAPLYATAYETIPANLILEIAYVYVTWGEVLSKIVGEPPNRGAGINCEGETTMPAGTANLYVALPHYEYTVCVGSHRQHAGAGQQRPPFWVGKCTVLHIYKEGSRLHSRLPSCAPNTFGQAGWIRPPSLMQLLTSSALLGGGPGKQHMDLFLRYRSQTTCWRAQSRCHLRAFQSGRHPPWRAGHRRVRFWQTDRHLPPGKWRRRRFQEEDRCL